MTATGTGDDAGALGPQRLGAHRFGLRGNWRKASALFRRSAPGTPRRWLRQQISIEQGARSAFALIPSGMIVGSVGVFAAGWRPPFLLLCLCALLLLAFLQQRRFAGALQPPVIFLLAAIAGTACATLEIARTHTVIFSGETTVRLTGRVLWRDRDERSRYRYLLEVQDTERPHLSRAPEQVRVLASIRHAPIPIGGIYRGLVRLRPPSGPAVPGGHDFAFAAFFEGPGAFGFSLGAPEQGVGAPDDLSLSERLASLRLAMGERITATIGGPEGAVAAALIMGDRAGIPDDIDDALRQTGLSHVLSISGLHMALVAGFVMFFVRAGLATLPRGALLLPSKKIAAVAALAASTFYLVLSGGGAATNRSFIMIVVMLVAVLFDRPALTLRNVALAAATLLVLTPHVVITASFQMSFAATAALVGVAGGLLRRREHEIGSAPRSRSWLSSVALFFLSLAGTSLVAGLATAPFSAYHFGRLAPFGLVANMVAIPMFSFWIMPLALLAVLLMPLGLDTPFLHLLGYGLTAVFKTAELLADVFPNPASGPITALGLALLSASIILAAFCASGLRWLALPIAGIGLLLAPDRGVMPDLLVFEDGQEIALLAGDGQPAYLRRRPSAFVTDQWERALGIGHYDTNGSGGAEEPRADPAFTCENDVCRATTRSGLRVSWTSKFEQMSKACEGSNLAIVARAVRQTSCPSGARLITLRTLRRTGSIAASRDERTTRMHLVTAITSNPNEWNRHRRARWPERWRNPDRFGPAIPGPVASPPAGVNDDGEVARESRAGQSGGPGGDEKSAGDAPP